LLHEGVAPEKNLPVSQYVIEKKTKTAKINYLVNSNIVPTVYIL